MIDCLSFTITGHENLLATHPTTLEFTTDTYLTKRGDCILGICATFHAPEVFAFMKKHDNQHVRITITAGEETDALEGKLCSSFTHSSAMVIRTSVFEDHRTFATKATKAAIHIKRSLVRILRDPRAQAEVNITCINN